MPVRCIMGTGFNDVPLQLIQYPPGSHRHPSGHNIAILAGTNTNHNPKITADDANKSDTKTTATLDDMASGCDLQKQRERGTDTECYCVYCEGLGEGNIERN